MSKQAVDFLVSLPGQTADLTAIHPTTGKKIVGRSFNAKGNAEDRAACAKWIESATAKGYGVYFNINALRIRLGIDERGGEKIMKANEGDVSVLHAFHVDADVSKDIADPAAFTAAKDELLRAVRGMNKPPSIIVDSGNGFGLFWVLTKPVKVTDSNREQLKAINVALRDAVRSLPGGSADACQNLDRVMRVPGTINYPNAAKLKRGRVEVPTDLIADDRDFGALYSPDDFEAAPPESKSAPADNEAIDIPDTVDLSSLSGPFKKLIEKGPLPCLCEGKIEGHPKTPHDQKIGDGTRSDYVYHVVCQLIEGGFADGEIVWFITNPDFKVSEHVLEQRQRGTPEAQAIKIVRDAKKRGAKYVSPEADFGSDPLPPLTDKQKREGEKIRAANFERMKGKVTYKDFLLYLPESEFICIPQGADHLWPAKMVSLISPPVETDIPKIDPKKKGKTPEECKAIDGTEDQFLRDKDGKIARVWIPASQAVADNPRQLVGGMTWWPGKPPVIYDTVFHMKGGAIPKTGMHAFNRYRPAHLMICESDRVAPKPWLDHIKLIYPEDWQHIVYWLAWRVQHPEEKIYHALVLGGSTRIGKDTILKPVAYAIGPWNFTSSNAQTIMDEPKYNGYLEGVICLISEARDFGDQDRYAFYERMKPWIGGVATGVLSVADKYVRAHPVVDVVCFIITTNHKVRGLYLPDDDARHYVAWSNRTWEDWGYATQDELKKKYFDPLYEWYGAGGYESVAHYLKTLDVSAFDPKAVPPKTSAWHEIVNAYADPKKSTLARILETLGNPEAVSVRQVQAADADGELQWLDAKGRNTIPADFEAVGFMHQRNEDTKSGRWTVGPKNSRKEVAIYVRAKLTANERMTAAREVHKLEQARTTAEAKRPADEQAERDFGAGG